MLDLGEGTSKLEQAWLSCIDYYIDLDQKHSFGVDGLFWKNGSHSQIQELVWGACTFGWVERASARRAPDDLNGEARHGWPEVLFLFAPHSAMRLQCSPYAIKGPKEDKVKEEQADPGLEMLRVIPVLCQRVLKHRAARGAALLLRRCLSPMAHMA